MLAPLGFVMKRRLSIYRHSRFIIFEIKKLCTDNNRKFVDEKCMDEPRTKLLPCEY